MKKILLVTDFKATQDVLKKHFGMYDFYPSKNKDTYVYENDEFSYVLEVYNSKKLKGLTLLFLLSKEDIKVVEELKNLEDLSDDKRYSKKYLKEFGNPQSYDFSLADVYQKCDSIGLAHMELNFSKAMNCAKVFRVLIYRLTQLLRLHLQNKELRECEEILEDLFGIFMLSKGAFEKHIMKKLLNLVVNRAYFLSEPKVQEEYFLNIEAFLYDFEGFFNAKKSAEAIYHCLKKSIYNALEEKTDKEIMMLQSAIKFFQNLFSKEELDLILVQSSISARVQ